MDPRLKIPALGLLGLGLTGCGADDNPIVGTWTAVKIDDKAFPVTESYGPNQSRLGFRMEIDPDLAGEFALYTHYDYGEIGVNSEQSEVLKVDDAAAPKHRITIGGRVIDFYFGRGEYGEGGYDDGGYSESGYDGEAHADARFERAAATRPIAAGDSVVLDCQLTGDTLDCTATGPADTIPEQWRFARKTDET